MNKTFKEQLIEAQELHRKQILDECKKRLNNGEKGRDCLVCDIEGCFWNKKNKGVNK